MNKCTNCQTETSKRMVGIGTKDPICISCYGKKWNRENAQKFEGYRKKWDLENPNSAKQRAKKWRDNNPEKSKEWGLENPEKKAITNHKSYIKNKKIVIERTRLYQNKRSKEDIGFRLAKILRSRLATALRKNIKNGSAVRDLGCSLLELKHHLESKFVCGMSWENYGKWHIDHIKPLSKFNLEDRNQLLEACNYKNLQPLWALDNLKKGSG
jgi:hypothetical protein